MQAPPGPNPTADTVRPMFGIGGPWDANFAYDENEAMQVFGAGVPSASDRLRVLRELLWDVYGDSQVEVYPPRDLGGGLGQFVLIFTRAGRLKCAFDVTPLSHGPGRWRCSLHVSLEDESRVLIFDSTRELLDYIESCAPADRPLAARNYSRTRIR